LEDIPIPDLLPLAFAPLLNAGVVVYSVEAVVLAGLLLCSALISGSEVAFFTLSPQQLEACRTCDSPAERAIAALLRNPKKMLATVLILNNLVNVGIVTLSTYMMISALGSGSADAALATSILTLVVTFFIVFFGEVVPKVYANQRSLPFAKFTAQGMLLMSRVVSPLAWLLMQMSSLVEKRIERKGYQATIDEINQALELTTTGGTTEEEREILRGIVNFGTIAVRQIMQPRLDITAVGMNMDFAKLLHFINEAGYSRLPVYHETVDRIEGLLYIKDLLPHLNAPADFAWQSLIRREIFFVPENKKIDQLMKDFQSRRVHMAIVVDEYGGTSGLITLEDIIEEIIGDINDEFDTHDAQYRQIDANTYSFEGKTSIGDFCKIIGVDPALFAEVRGEGETLAGLMLELFARMPRAGERKRFHHLLFTILALDKKRIKTVRITLKKPEVAPRDLPNEEQKNAAR
jgi:putative hemolysin